MPQPPEEAFVDPRVELRSSPIQGNGLFANAPIKKGELVLQWGGGEVVTNEEFEKGFAEGKYQPESSVHFDADHKWATPADEPDDIDAAINHSCDPNLWYENGWPLVARKDIAKDEELTFDYATGETYPLNSACKCGSPNCRGRVTGEEWKDPEFRKRYEGHMNPYIQSLIDREGVR
jgi:SET domain-containing protein